MLFFQCKVLIIKPSYVVRRLEWSDGQWRKQRLIELSDQNYRSVWELIESHPESEVAAVITTVQLYRITEVSIHPCCSYCILILVLIQPVCA